jgi:hypothetical protein
MPYLHFWKTRNAAMRTRVAAMPSHNAIMLAAVVRDARAAASLTVALAAGDPPKKYQPIILDQDCPELLEG